MTTSSNEGALRPWHFFVALSMVAASAAVLLARDNRPINLVMISLSVLAAGFVGHAAHRTLWPLVAGGDVHEGTGLGARARAALAREKALVLRSIKELEFDRAMGKVADADFEDMAGRLRARAIGLMKQLDAQPAGYRDAIERDLRARLGAAGLAGPAAPVAAPAATCARCGTRNDADARFCKGCGSKL
jgi:hypothetical protein